MMIKILITVFSAIALFRVGQRFKEKQISARELLLWGIFWASVVGIGWYPEIMNRAADMIGVGRGVDVAIYFALLLIFYILFRLLVRLEKMERNITKIVRRIALDRKKDNN